MADLPIPSTSPPLEARQNPSSSPRDATSQAGSGSFQTTLAQELGLVHDAPSLLELAVPSPAGNADTGLNYIDDSAQAKVAAETPFTHAFISLLPLPPNIADAPPPLPPTFPSARTARTEGELEPRQYPLAATFAGSRSALLLQRTSDAADLAVPDMFLPTSTEQIQHEFTFDQNIFDQIKAAPTAATGIHAGSAPAQVTQAPAAALNTPLGQRGWDQGLGDHLVWMAGQKQQVAELHLNPPEIGPLKITLTLNDDQASAQFVSAHAVVREAIETAMPRLREMLADSGITLGDTSVSAEAFREQTQQDPRRESHGYAAQHGIALTDSGNFARRTQLHLGQGMVDTYA